MKVQIWRLTLMSFCALGTLLAVAFGWKSYLIVIVLLAILGFLMMLIEKKWDAVLLYLITFFCGALSEAIAVHFGAWSYTLPQFIGISAWLPFLWGNAGLYIRRLNEFIVYIVK